MKISIGIIFITSVFTSGMTMAEYELEILIKPQEERDTHLSWHQFQHELNSYAQVQAQMNL